MRHARYGIVDLAEDETNVAECPAIISTGSPDDGIVEIDRFLKVEERVHPRYKGYHISAELNDLDHSTGDKIIDNAGHFERLKAKKRDWVCSHVERYLPFLLAQFDMRARSLINLAELKAFADHKTWREPTGPIITAMQNGKPVDPEPFYGKKVEVRPYPLAEVGQRFLSRDGVYEDL